MLIHAILHAPGGPPEDGEMNEMTLPSRHRIRNSNSGGLRPSSLPLGPGGSSLYWIFTNEQGRNILLFLILECQREDWARDLLLQTGYSSAKPEAKQYNPFAYKSPKTYKNIFLKLNFKSVGYNTWTYNVMINRNLIWPVTYLVSASILTLKALVASLAVFGVGICPSNNEI